MDAPAHQDVRIGSADTPAPSPQAPGRRAPVDPDPFAAEVSAELHRIHIGQAATMPYGEALLLPALFYSVSEYVPLWQAGGWLGATAFFLFLRHRVAIRTDGAGMPAGKLRGRVRLIGLLTTLTGLVAGVGPMAWFPELLLAERALFTIAYVAWYAATIVVSLVSPITAFVFGAALLGPLTVAWATSSGEHGLLVAVILLMLLFFVRQAVDGAYEAMRGSIRSRLREQDLISRLEQRGRELEAAMRAKTQFLAAASHDLRQPVTSMNLLLSALLGAPNEVVARRVASKFEAPLQALDSILSSLLEMSRLEAGTVEVDKRACRIRDIVLTVQAEYAPRASAKHLLLRSEVPDISVRTDPEIMRRILRNLVDNAVKFTDQGGVLLSADSDGRVLTLRVSDTGRGIPPEARDRIFEDYFQGENPHRDRSAGLGLGLAIVRRLVALLDGDIRLASQPGRGSVFEVTVPAILPVDAAGTAPERFDVLLAPRSLPFRSALVIDDDELVREALSALLNTYEVDARFVASATEALQAVDAYGFRPDVALVDFGLPGDMDGIALAAALRERLPAVRTLLITGDTRPELLRRASDDGIDVLHKPFTATRLAAALSRPAAGRTTTRA